MMSNKYWKRVNNKCRFENMLFRDELEKARIANKKEKQNQWREKQREKQREKRGK